MKRKLLAKRFLTIVSLILVLSLPVATVAVAAEKMTYRQNGYAAVASWYNGETYWTIYTDDTNEGTDVYLYEYTTPEDQWSGYKFDVGLLYVDHKLAAAALATDMFLINWQTGESKYAYIDAVWTSTGELAEGKSRDKETYGDITVRYKSRFSSANATAVGAINGESPGELLYASIDWFKTAFIISQK